MWEAKVEGASEKTLPKISLLRFLSLSSTMLASTSAPAHQQQRCCLPHSHSSSRRRHRTTRIAADKFCRDVVSTPRDKPVDDGSESIVTFVGAGGKEIAIQCKKSEYILDAGLEAGLELPYTCRAGICGACVGKVVAGEVDQSDVREFQVFFFWFQPALTKRSLSLLTFLSPSLAIRLKHRHSVVYRSTTSLSRSRSKRLRR